MSEGGLLTGHSTLKLYLKSYKIFKKLQKIYKNAILQLFLTNQSLTFSQWWTEFFPKFIFNQLKRRPYSCNDWTIWFQPYLRVVPVHVELVPVEDVGRLVDVLDGKPDRRHDPSPDLALGGAGGHGEKRGKINVSSETKQNVIYYSSLRIPFRTVKMRVTFHFMPS